MANGQARARRFLLGLVPARTGGAIAVMAAGCVAGTVGCDMTRYEAGDPQSVPACEGIDIGESDFEPEAYWTFDPSADTDCPLSVTNGKYTLFAGTDPGHELPTCDSTVRLNGFGSSLTFDGGQYYYLPNTSSASIPSITEGGTIAAWISLPEGGMSVGTRRPIISTIPQLPDTGHGYELDLRRESNGQQKLVFSYYDESGNLTAIEAPLDVPSWGWGSGRWHHVAVVYAPQIGDTAQLRLHWDVESLPGSRMALGYGKPMATPSGALSVGRSQQDIDSTLRLENLEGRIDDIALFSRPLTAASLAQFSLGSTTRGPGPGGCRWRASETDRSAAVGADGVPRQISTERSTATWITSSYDLMEVSVHDGDWGNGGLSARLAAPGSSRNLSSFRYVEFAASLPAIETQNGAFEFALVAGNDSCTWYVPHQADNVYRIDLQNPGFCQTDPTRCAFPIDRVEWATIRSSTIYPTSWIRGLLDVPYAVTQFAFIPSKSQLDWSEMGGLIGPNSLCWRRELFQTPRRISADTRFEQRSGILTAHLTGLDYSGPAVVADLGDSLLNVQNAFKNPVIVGLSNVTSANSVGLVITLQDRFGTWMQADLDPSDDNSTFRSSLSTASKCQKAEDKSGIDLFDYPWKDFPEIDSGAITYVKLQKKWLRDGEIRFDLSGISL